MSGPLSGLRVVEMAGIGPAPLAATLLTDLGAEVLRICRPDEMADGLDGFGRGRPHLRLNLKDPADQGRLHTILAACDVLLEGFRPGVAERLGFGPDVALERNPRLIYARMTGWGQQGPRALQAGHDINYISVTGGLHAIGEAGRKPVPPLNLVGDFGGGTAFVVIGILAALHERGSSGKGQVIDAAMIDGATYLMSMLFRDFNKGIWRDERGVNSLDGGAPHYSTYETSDGEWMAVGSIEPPFYAELLDKLGLTDAPERTRENWPKLSALFASRFLTKTREQWTEIFATSDACVSPVLSLTEAPHEAHLAARGTFIAAPDGSGVEPAPAPRFSRTPAVRSSSEDTAGLLAAWGVD